MTKIIIYNLILGAKVCSAAFKLPSLSKKRRRILELAEFSWNSTVIKEELGSSTFGSVYLANFNIAGEPRCVVVKNRKVNHFRAGD